MEATPFRLVIFASRDRIEGAHDAWPVIAFCDPASYVGQEGDYIYAPTTAPLTINHLHNVAIALAVATIDFVIISHGLEALPLVKMGIRRDALVVRHELIDVLLNNHPLPTGCCGRFVRLVPPPVESVLLRKDISDVLGAACCARESYVTVGFLPKSPHVEPVLKLNASRASALSFDKVTILVMPAMFAVGGVERNTIEIMRALQDRYRFVIVTNEPHLNERGSLHEQLEGITAGVFDLAELAGPDSYLDILMSIGQIYGIDLIWICNGSCWLVLNAEALRENFAHVPIVDQQVYDTKEGWIAHFDKLSLRSFDRYVAVNQSILATFMNRFGIGKHKIDLIYPAIDATRFRRLPDSFNSTIFRKSLEVPPHVNLFAMVGRLTRQKRPKDFLELALRAQAAGLPDVFLIVGQGELAAECQAFVQVHELNNVRFLGHCSDPSKLYPEISGLLVMSEFEGLPIVSLEAMAMGIPVLATDVGDLRKIFAEHRVGHLFSTIGDPAVQFDEFCAWRQTLADHAKRSAESADDVRDRFSSKAVAVLYDDCFRRAIANRKLSPRSAARAADTELASLSVVLPTFNRSTLLKDNLHRCAELSRDLDIEFIVIDDGSTDETSLRLAEMAQQFPNLTWRRVSNGGPGQARNIGASIACKEVILFIGDDIEPLDDEFFRVHARLHARNRRTNFAVLGKIVWPQRQDAGTKFVMAHIQGRGGEQYRYADMAPFTFYDYRFFYTSNVSIKRTIVDNWLEEGFSKEFKLAGYEDAEFAYRMQKRPEGLKIFYDPTSVGAHHHQYNINSFFNRQMAVGMMAAVFARLHPEVCEAIGIGDLQRAVRRPCAPGWSETVGDHLSVIEGFKSYARILENQGNLGVEHWHDDLLAAVFEAAYSQGFLSATAAANANFAAAYQLVMGSIFKRLRFAVHRQVTGDVFPVLSHAGRRVGVLDRLRTWAIHRPKIVALYRRLRQWRVGR
jgi:glycosyltransferase involved in cell wall biosynthesis